MGDIGCLSFNGNKIITTGGGGALLTNNGDLAKNIRHLSTTAKLAHPWDFVHDEIGWNDRLPNLNAALGCAQMECLPQMIHDKAKLYDVYCDLVSNIPGVELVTCSPSAVSNNWLISVMFTDPDIFVAQTQRLQCLEDFHRENILIRPCWKLISELPMYKKCPSSDLSVSIEYSRRLLSLPSSPKLLKSA